MPSAPQDHKKKPSKKKKQEPSSDQTADAKYAPTNWLAGGFGQLEDTVVPSGQLCLTRRPGVEGLMQAGVLHNVDSLSGIVNEKFISKDGSIDAKSLMNDDDALGNILHTVDRVVCFVVVKPEIVMTPNDVTRRKDGVVYADMIDLMDKMFLFNYAVGGTRDLESFRRELISNVGGLASGEDVPDQAEQHLSDN